ncbi:MAG: hypothetical protein AAGD25_05875 [Cyanobacteria bacterium P01_F01_bin.150]
MEKNRQKWILALLGLIVAVLVQIAQKYLQQAFPGGIFYQSNITLLGYPLLDIRIPSHNQVMALQYMPLDEAMKLVTSTGWFAMGIMSFGVIALGPGAIGIVSFGVGSLGCIAFGVLSVALFLAFGCMALSFFKSWGILAISWFQSRGLQAIDRNGSQFNP